MREREPNLEALVFAHVYVNICVSSICQTASRLEVSIAAAPSYYSGKQRVGLEKGQGWKVGQQPNLAVG